MAGNQLAPRQKSERVIINSPMSFAGAAQRSSRLLPGGTAGLPIKLVAWPAVVALILVWWAFIIVWYAITIGLFWFLTFPYRLLRRGARKRKAQALRHRELLAAVERNQTLR